VLFRSPAGVVALCALVVLALACLLPAGALARWKHVSRHRSRSQPFFACERSQALPARCNLIVDPTRGLRRNGPVAAGAITMGPAQEASPALGGSGVEGGYSPEDLRKAYNLTKASAANGAGQTVAIVDAHDDPNAEEDMNVYRKNYGITPCTSAGGCFRKINQSGGSVPPNKNVEWSEEISLDLDMVSAICPKCNILLVEANTASSEDLAVAVNEAVKQGATEISNSYGSPQGSEPAFASSYHHPGIPITVAAGDEGYRVEIPADNPHVIAVGGTSLTPEKNKRGWNETVWYGVEGGVVSGTGSGCSNEPKPSWQTDLGCAFRTNNDIAVVGDQNTPVSAYNSYCGKVQCETPWSLEGGTSVGTPIVAAAMALSSGYTRSFDGAHALYIDANLAAQTKTNAFNDVISGKDGNCGGSYLCEAREGYDGPSGLGTLSGVPEIPPPAVESKPASEVASAEATVNATVDPNGPTIVTCEFEYGTSNSYGASLPCSKSPGSGISPVAVSARLTKLSSSTTYHFRIAAVTEGEPFRGADQSFTTAASGPQAPSVLTEASSGVELTAATLNAKVDPNGQQITSCVFEYGTSSALGSSAGCKPEPGSGSSYVSVSATVTGLAEDTPYYYRVTASSAAGTTHGLERSFATPFKLPIVAPHPASEVSQTEATLNGTVNPSGVKIIECSFEYGRSTAYETTVPCSTTPGEGHTAVPVSAAIAELLPGRVYHFRVLARNPHGTSTSADASFLTATEAPAAVTEAAVTSGTSSATLTGTVLPNGAAITACRFEYGTSPAGILEASVPCSSLPAGTEEGETVSAAVSGLAAGVTYHYRLVAGNSSGSSYGATLAFTTGAPTIQGEGGLEELTGGHGQPGPGLPTLASRKLSVNAHGSLVVRVQCPAGSSTCAGTISLQAVMAAGASPHARRHSTKHHVLLASGSFKVRGGRVSAIRLRLSHTARTLLRRAHVLHASATITPAAGKAARTTVTIHSG
jgi:hypothetical protein